MSKYKLLINGFGMESSAHNLTSDEVKIILDAKEEGNHEELSEMYSMIPDLIENNFNFFRS